MMVSGGVLPRLSSTLFLLSSLATIIVGISGQALQSCPANLLPPNTVTSLGVTPSFCKQVGVSGAIPSAAYNLWYTLDNSTSPNTLSVILSVPRESQARWYGMGFNPAQNSMPGTDAIIFWLNQQTSKPVVGTYYLTQQSVSSSDQNSNRLSFKGGNKPTVVVDANNLYLTYVVEQTTPSNFAYQNFVIGRPNEVPTGTVMGGQNQHQGVSSVQINFVTGSAVVTTVNGDGRRTTHGVLNIIGWGVLLPIGAIVARYARAFDPHWFYFHAAAQIVGYVFVLAGLITGFKLENLYAGANISGHKALGIILIILATLQLSAVLIRPKKEAKLRRYWNWGHGWTGRVALVIGVVNIFVGIHVANASSTWKVAYGVVLSFELLAVVILESLLWVNYVRNKNDSLPKTAQHNRDRNGHTAPSEISFDGRA